MPRKRNKHVRFHFFLKQSESGSFLFWRESRNALTQFWPSFHSTSTCSLPPGTWAVFWCRGRASWTWYWGNPRKVLGGTSRVSGKWVHSWVILLMLYNILYFRRHLHKHDLIWSLSQLFGGGCLTPPTPVPLHFRWPSGKLPLTPFQPWVCCPFLM